MSSNRGLMACPFCGEEEVEPAHHFPQPEGKGCPYTPMTRSTSLPAPSRVEGTERQGRSIPAGGSVLPEPAEGRDAADPATTLN
jgi:hypothetical protein